MSSIILTPLSQHYLPTGNVMHGLRSSESSYKNFGELYFSRVHPGSFKGWKRHLQMTMNLIVISGDVRFFFTDGFESYESYTIGDSNYARLTVPPCIWFGFTGVSTCTSTLCNLADIEHDPTEIERVSPSHFSFTN